MNRPKVIANFALSLDLRASTREHSATGFGSAEDKQLLRSIRAMGDAVLAGAGTVRTDRMSMGISDDTLVRQRVARGQAEQPLRVIVSNSGRLDATWPLWEKPYGAVHIFTTRAMPEEVRTALRENASLHIAESDAVNLQAMMEELAHDHGVGVVVCEGGPTLMRGLLEQALVDELYVTLCPQVFGGREAAGLTGTVKEFLPEELQAELVSMRTEGEEAYLHYRIVPAWRRLHERPTE